MEFNQVFNQKGNSLIQVLVAGGIMVIISLSVASMMSNQNKEAKAMGEKLLSYELESQMKALFENSDYCNCAFQGKTFDMTQAPPVIVAADQFANLVNGYSVPVPTCTTSGGNFIPAVGVAVPGSTMTVGSLGLGGLTLVSAGVYKADLRIGFNNSLRSMKPMKTNVQFSINMAGGTGPSARPFVSCSGATAGSGWELAGNSGTTTANFIGTTDNANILFKRNNINAGMIASNNTSLGVNTISPSAFGSLNVAIGASSLNSNTTGSDNTAVGAGALAAATAANGNVGIGKFALGQNLTGSGNVAIGISAGGGFFAKGDNNIYIGNNANPNGAIFDNAIAIGSGAIVGASNSVRIGNNAITLIAGQVAWTSVSDARLKRDVEPYPYGLDLVRELRPVSFTFKSDATRKRQMGFIAQEVEATGFPFYGLKKPTSDKDYYSLTYSDFVMPIVNSVQELDRQNNDLKNQISDLRLEIATIHKFLEKSSCANEWVSLPRRISFK